MTRKSKAQIKREQREEIRQWITVLVIGAVILLGLMKSGIVGRLLYQLQRYLFGTFFWLILGMIVVLIFVNMYQRRQDQEEKNPAPVILIICGILLLSTLLSTKETGMGVFMQYIQHISDYFTEEAMTMNVGGGICGAFLYAIISKLFDRLGVWIAFILCISIATILLVSVDYFKHIFHVVVDFLKAPEYEEEEIEPEPEPEEEKPAPNLWAMIESLKEKKKEKMPDIQADDPDIMTPTVDIMTTKKETEIPQMTKLINITADDEREEIPVVSIPGKVISSEKSVFINVDDLLDQYEPQPESLEDTQEIRYDQPQVTQSVPTYEPEPEPKKQEVQQPSPQPAAPQPKRPGEMKNYKVPTPRVISQMLDPIPNQNSLMENQAAAKEKGQLLINILHNFDIEAELIDVHIGPSVTQFEIKPNVNVKVSKILGLADNIKMALAAKDVRIEAPIPGRNAVGIEIPNVKSTPVKMREIINDVSDKNRKQPLLFYVGKDLLGQTVTCRLDKMPHLLIAGATGSGKSVCMNAIITSLLLRTHPEDVKMLLVDPKKVEFTPYQKIPHLIGPVINDPNQANNALKAIVQIMDERYNIFASVGVRNIEVYNQKVKEQNGCPNPDGSPAPKKMPYIVVIIDELADLMAVAGKEVELSIQRITQLARAAGIHLIVATQRPSVDVITGIIKANIPSRIAFAVSSGTDSRTILDHTGAERLLGNGDMLYMPIGQSGATRVQGVFVTDEEVYRITDYVSSQATPFYDDKFIMLEGVNDGEGGAVVGINDDPLFIEVKNYVIEAQKASTSLLQRRFGIGYNRAARMIDALEESGVIGPAQGSRPRDVYMKPDKQVQRTETGEVIDD